MNWIINHFPFIFCSNIRTISTTFSCYIRINEESFRKSCIISLY
nr:MAG TPA: hypothetical protein [Bacteriophage sp.]